MLKLVVNVMQDNALEKSKKCRYVMQSVNNPAKYLVVIAENHFMKGYLADKFCDRFYVTEQTPTVNNYKTLDAEFRRILQGKKLYFDED